MASDDLFEGLSGTDGATSQRASHEPLAGKRQNTRGNHQSSGGRSTSKRGVTQDTQQAYSGTPYAPKMRPRDFSSERNIQASARNYSSQSSNNKTNYRGSTSNADRNTARKASSYSSMPAQQEKTKRRSNSSVRKAEKENKDTSKKERIRGEGLFGGRSIGVVFNDCILWTIEHMPIMFFVAVLSIVVGLFVNRYISFTMAFVFCLWGVLADRRFPERDPFIYFGLLALGVFIIPYLF